jgi:hypothetical protein
MQEIHTPDCDLVVYRDGIHTCDCAASAAPVRCSEHPAYDADYCPVCGTARVIGGTV